VQATATNIVAQERFEQIEEQQQAVTNTEQVYMRMRGIQLDSDSSVRTGMSIPLITRSRMSLLRCETSIFMFQKYLLPMGHHF
jgi:hypothetical protein